MRSQNTVREVDRTEIASQDSSTGTQAQVRGRRAHRERELTISESLLLLLARDGGVEVVATSEWKLSLGLVGAILMDLVELGRIRYDEDSGAVVLANSLPTGIRMLDAPLASITRIAEPLPVSSLVARFTDKAHAMVKRGYDDLTDKGVLDVAGDFVFDASQESTRMNTK